MADGFGLTQILEWTGGRLINGDVLGAIPTSLRVEHLSVLGAAKSRDCAFFFSKQYQTELLSTEAGVIITGEDFVLPLQSQASVLPFWKKSAIVACRDPYFAMAVLSEKFAKGVSTVAHIPGERAGLKTSIHPSAVIDPSVQVGEGVQIGPHCVVDAGAKIGRGVVLYPRVHVGPSAEIGEDSVLFTGVTLYEWTRVGRRARIHAGSTIGSDGFGYAPQNENGVPVNHKKIYHLGRVVIGDDVEIGANTMIDRATLGETRIGDKVKLDNNVHIGHNSVLREGALLCGGASLAGGTVIGKFVFVGGLSGIGNKAELGDYSKVVGTSMVDKDVRPGEISMGNPQRSRRDHLRAHAILNRLLAEHDGKGRGARSKREKPEET